MRKMLVSVAALLFMMASLVVAAEVTVAKYDKDKKEVTVKDDKDKEKTYKITDKTKVTLVDKEGKATDDKGTVEDLERRLEFMGKGGKGGKGGGKGGGGFNKLDITTDGDKITEVK